MSRRRARGVRGGGGDEEDPLHDIHEDLPDAARRRLVDLLQKEPFRCALRWMVAASRGGDKDTLTIEPNVYGVAPHELMLFISAAGTTITVTGNSSGARPLDAFIATDSAVKTHSLLAFRRLDREGWTDLVPLATVWGDATAAAIQKVATGDASAVRTPTVRTPILRTPTVRTPAVRAPKQTRRVK